MLSQEERTRLEGELLEAREASRAASKRASEAMDKVRVSAEEAERANGERKKSVDDIQKQVLYGWCLLLPYVR